MKKSGSVINVPALCILIVNFLGDVLLHILQKEKIGPKITAKIDRVVAALKNIKPSTLSAQGIMGSLLFRV